MLQDSFTSYYYYYNDVANVCNKAIKQYSLTQSGREPLHSRNETSGSVTRGEWLETLRADQFHK